ncbi:ABC transporter ATP-binding protein [Maritimibacter sp. 55A14]|uniref:ABC transporter ATP-binding protein n=1 Tax=Maritimibacter sp. 55A14 TaxID=2174844 RepID=UPI000D60591E|nr:ABC transporter ATP-binding protein [Maritimibacter sp. 55A14]PWE31284.1 ABC transporter ATP-binding protein [Maritimibacter sp. 55A14]
MLSLKDVWAHYGSVAAVKGISVEVAEAEIVTLIGSNGAGKTTTMRTICGLHKPTKGEILFEGKRINGLDPEKINALGIAMVPEGRHVFPQLTVMENLEMGAYLRKDAAGIRRDLEEMFTHFPILKERHKQLAGTMSGGQQQMVAMARALMSGPKVLLLDEPSLGLSPLMTQQIAKIIKKLNEIGRTIVLVEQNARLAFLLAKRAYVMEIGRISMSGLTVDLKDDPKVRETYLGV